MLHIHIKRVYEAPSAGDGSRILVDRVWPRGMTKMRLQGDAWLKNVAPSTQLRKWFNHDPLRWNEFRERYFRELDENSEGLATLVAAVKKGTVTLLYSAKDTDRNQAVALKEYLSSRRAIR